jgi:hypothetical protein
MVEARITRIEWCTGYIIFLNWQGLHEEESKEKYCFGLGLLKRGFVLDACRLELFKYSQMIHEHNKAAMILLLRDRKNT